MEKIMNKEPMLSNDEEPLPFITKPSDYLPKFEIPLV
jgi:hypothetical protein